MSPICIWTELSYRAGIHAYRQKLIRQPEMTRCEISNCHRLPPVSRFRTYKSPILHLLHHILNMQSLTLCARSRNVNIMHGPTPVVAYSIGHACKLKECTSQPHPWGSIGCSETVLGVKLHISQVHILTGLAKSLRPPCFGLSRTACQSVGLQLRARLVVHPLDWRWVGSGLHELEAYCGGFHPLKTHQRLVTFH